MRYVRIIPRLDIKGLNLVKGVHLEGLRILGKPERFARYYYEQGADELLYLDVVASLYGRNNLLEIVEKTSREIFIPLTVGGGIRSIEDIRTVLRAGADKIALNTAAIKRPELINEAANHFGMSTIVISIEAKKMPDGSYEAYIDNGRERTGIEVFSWAKEVSERGAGEILITSIDREGTGDGFDLELVGKIAKSVPVSVISCGGAGKIDDIYDALTKSESDAVALASILHYDVLDRNNYLKEDFVKGDIIEAQWINRSFSKVDHAGVPNIKKDLRERGIMCRWLKDE